LLGGVVSDFAVKSDMNKAGLVKAKKDPVKTDGGKKQFQNEDESLCLCPFEDDINMAFFGVFDGHAGKEAAKAAKELLPKEFATKLKQERANNPAAELTDVGEIFKKTFRKVDELMSTFEYQGCTATVVFCWNSQGHKFIQAANVGDSSAFLWRSGVGISDSFVELTVDHKPTHKDEQERLRKEGVEITDTATRLNGLSVSRSLGDHFPKTHDAGLTCEPHVSQPIKLGPKEESILLLASDGLWDVLSGRHAMELVKDTKSADAATNKLMQTALMSPKCQDNVSVVCVVMHSL